MQGRQSQGPRRHRQLCTPSRPNRTHPRHPALAQPALFSPLLTFKDSLYEEQYQQHQVGIVLAPRPGSSPPQLGRHGSRPAAVHTPRRASAVQLGRRIFHMSEWAPLSDPLLLITLLALHATLLLRLALAGGLELLPLPLVGAYVSWHCLRMTYQWVRGGVRACCMGRMDLRPAA